MVTSWYPQYPYGYFGILNKAYSNIYSKNSWMKRNAKEQNLCLAKSDRDSANNQPTDCLRRLVVSFGDRYGQENDI